MNKSIYKYIGILILLIIAALLVTNSSIYKKSHEMRRVTVDNTPVGSKVTPIYLVTYKDNSTSSPKISYEYPQFSNLPDAFNEAIASATLSRVQAFKVDVADNRTAREATGVADEAKLSIDAYTFISSWQPIQINDDYISIIMRYDMYTGGSGGLQDLKTFNYDISNNKPVVIADLLGNRSDYLQYLSDTAREQLRQSQTEGSSWYTPGEMLTSGTEPVLENFSNFTFTDNSITVYFPKYAVAPGSFGEQEISIPRTQ